MALVDMKRTKAEKKDSESKYNTPCSPGGDDYPYGLSVRLGSEELKKLGISSLPQVGEQLELCATAYVKSASENQRDGGKKERSVELELRQMSLEPTADATDHESLMHGAKAAMDKALDDEED
jgi:hypothetical protein